VLALANFLWTEHVADAQGRELGVHVIDLGPDDSIIQLCTHHWPFPESITGQGIIAVATITWCFEADTTPHAHRLYLTGGAVTGPHALADGLTTMIAQMILPIYLLPCFYRSSRTQPSAENFASVVASCAATLSISPCLPHYSYTILAIRLVELPLVQRVGRERPRVWANSVILTST
jgi:hypothetical protein